MFFFSSHIESKSNKITTKVIETSINICIWVSVNFTATSRQNLFEILKNRLYNETKKMSIFNQHNRKRR